MVSFRQIAVPIATATATKLTERKQDIGKEAAIEAEVRAARERALVPLETRVISFKEMLKEKDVRKTNPNEIRNNFKTEKIKFTNKNAIRFAGICI